MKDTWYVLLQQHLDAGQIWPSYAAVGSAAFIVSKSNPTVLPRWVNNYCQLNANMVTDSFPIPCIDNILADCTKGKFWATIDMTNSFFQTHMHPDDIHLTAVNTPWGLYEWLIMPMGIQNAPAIHQQWVTAALCPFIGKKFCHVYLDDIIIWSETLDEHFQNVRKILQALEDTKPYCNPKKTKLFCSTSSVIKFLHEILSLTQEKWTISRTGQYWKPQVTYAASWGLSVISQLFYPSS